MEYVIQAIYENGVLKPLEKLDLGEHQQVQITVAVASGGTVSRQQEQSHPDPLEGVRTATGIADLAEHFDDYRFGRRRT